MQFIHLRVHSAYSLAEGAVKVKALPKLCSNNNMPAIGITDTNNLFGALEIRCFKIIQKLHLFLLILCLKI